MTSNILDLQNGLNGSRNCCTC